MEKAKSSPGLRYSQFRLYTTMDLIALRSSAIGRGDEESFLLLELEIQRRVSIVKDPTTEGVEM